MLLHSIYIKFIYNASLMLSYFSTSPQTSIEWAIAVKIPINISLLYAVVHCVATPVPTDTM